MGEFAPGSLWWWAEREGGRVVHWSLARSHGAPSWMGGSVAVVSVRSGRRYCAGPEDLIPYEEMPDPREKCATCGAERRGHRKRHAFKEADRG